MLYIQADQMKDAFSSIIKEQKETILFNEFITEKLYSNFKDTYKHYSFLYDSEDDMVSVYASLGTSYFVVNKKFYKIPIQEVFGIVKKYYNNSSIGLMYDNKSKTYLTDESDEKYKLWELGDSNYSLSFACRYTGTISKGFTEDFLQTFENNELKPFKKTVNIIATKVLALLDHYKKIVESTVDLKNK
jgi:hypothetical protein